MRGRGSFFRFPPTPSFFHILSFSVKVPFRFNSTVVRYFQFKLQLFNNSSAMRSTKKTSGARITSKKISRTDSKTVEDLRKHWNNI